MSRKIMKTEDTAPVNAIDALAETMTEFRDEMVYYDNVGEGIAAKTRFIMRMVFVTLSISSIYLIVMIFQMASNMGVMTAHLEDMYGRFGNMSEDMRQITRTVDVMGKSITGLPQIALSMSDIDNDVSEMSDSVFGMNNSVTSIDNDMVNINSSMNEMTARLSNMNRSVNMMSYDVNEMAAPMNSGPMLGFWPW